jgi:hypothetical protein
MMVIMRPFPDTGRRQDKNTESRKEQVCHLILIKDSMMLVIVINDKHPYENEPTAYAA